MNKNDYGQWEATLKPLPCPFCGEIPSVEPENPMKDGDAGGTVECKNELCFVKPTVDDDEEILDMRGPGAYKDIAIRRWNKRA